MWKARSWGMKNGEGEGRWEKYLPEHGNVVETHSDHVQAESIVDFEQGARVESKGKDLFIASSASGCQLSNCVVLIGQLLDTKWVLTNADTMNRSSIPNLAFDNLLATSRSTTEIIAIAIRVATTPMT